MIVNSTQLRPSTECNGLPLDYTANFESGTGRRSLSVCWCAPGSHWKPHKHLFQEEAPPHADMWLVGHTPSPPRPPAIDVGSGHIQISSPPLSPGSVHIRGPVLRWRHVLER